MQAPRRGGRSRQRHQHVRLSRQVDTILNPDNFSRLRYSFSIPSISFLALIDFCPRSGRHISVVRSVSSPSTWIEPLPARRACAVGFDTFNLANLLCNRIIHVPGEVKPVHKSAPSVKVPVHVTDRVALAVYKEGCRSRRIHESFEAISTTRISGGRELQEFANCSLETHIVTGSNWLIALATFTCRLLDRALLRLSSCQGVLAKSSRLASGGSNSPGHSYPSLLGVDSF